MKNYNTLVLTILLTVLFYNTLPCEEYRSEIVTNSTHDDGQLRCTFVEKKILHDFFSDLLSSTPAGYVLYGNKPIYIGSPTTEKNCCIGTQLHQELCEQSEVLGIWKNLKPQVYNSNYIFHISEPSNDENCLENEFLIINKAAFLKAVQNNLILFQYNLGIHVTPETLLARLLDPKENISSIFKGNIALLGIVLGYGTKNSLIYERGTHIKKQLLARKTLLPPYKSDAPTLNEQDVIQKCSEAQISLKDAPTFGYTSLYSELEDISHSLAPPMTTPTGAFIGFSYIRDTQESQDLIAMYEKAHVQVLEKLNSPLFLEEILEKFGISLDSASAKDICDTHERNKNVLPSLVARSIYEHCNSIEFGDERVHYLDYFITGMKQADSSTITNYEAADEVQFLDSYQHQLTLLQKIHRNYVSARAYFKTLEKQSDIICIEPLKIYYSISKPGNGSAVCAKTDKLSIYYMVKDIDNNFVSGSYRLAAARTFQLAQLIPSLVHGIQGMKRNEVRNVYIHQDYAYGVHTEIGSGKALCICVELVDFQNSFENSADEKALPDLIPCDLAHLPECQSLTKPQLSSLKEKYISFCGFRTWMHYRKAKNYFNLATILNEVRKIQDLDERKISLTDTDREQLRKFDLSLYSILP